MANSCCTLRSQEERDRIFARSIADKAYELAQRGQFENAQALIAASMSLLSISGGSENAEGCLVHNRVAFVHYLQGDVEGSLPHWRKSLDIAEKVHGELHVATAMGRSNLGQIYLEAGKIDLADELITRAWSDLSQLPPTDDESELSWRASISADTRGAVERLNAAKTA